jgi:hypothetical protein
MNPEEQALTYIKTGDFFNNLGSWNQKTREVPFG